MSHAGAMFHDGPRHEQLAQLLLLIERGLLSEAELADFLRSRLALRGLGPSSEEPLACALGNRFYGTQIVEQILGTTIPLADKLHLYQTMPESHLLPRDPSGHVLIADPGLPLSVLRNRKPTHFYERTHAWFETEAFAQHTGAAGWVWLRTTAVPDSCGKVFANQQILLNDREYVPPSRIVALATVLAFERTGKRLFDTVSVRCGDVDRLGGRVCIGPLTSSGLLVGAAWDYTHDPTIGLASAGL
jgi:hypothetical protein